MSRLEFDVNQFPSLTWNFLGINRARMEFDAEPNPSNSPGPKVPAVERESFSSIRTALGAEFDAAVDSLSEEGAADSALIEAGAEEKGLFRKSEFSCGEGASVKDILIHARPGSDCRVVLVFRGGGSMLGARIRVLAEEGSRVRLATVNMLGPGCVHFNSIGALCMDGAAFELSGLELGGARVYSGALNVLSGFRSRFEGRVSYVAGGDSVLDMNHVSIHAGRQSESFLEVDGVLSGSAKKTWRGTIDFKRGCPDSVGDEQEDVLLLCDDAENKSLPVILCDEEAVDGRHGCSIGRLDAKKLFYMQSRGIDAAVAQGLLAMAKVARSARRIQDEGLEAEILSEVSGRFGI